METKNFVEAERERILAELSATLEARRPRTLRIMAFVSITVAASLYCIEKIGNLVETYIHVNEALNPTPNGMQVWVAGAKDQFSRELLAAGWRRWEAANTFIYMKEYREAERATLDNSLGSYLATVNEWNARYTTNLMGLEYYYGKQVPEI